MAHHPPESLFSHYLGQIGKVVLLTPEEEIELSRKIQAAIALQDRLKNQPQDLRDSLDQSEVAKTLATGKWAKDKLIRANLRLVVSIVKKYQTRSLEVMDLVQEGNLGLERAAQKFDPSKGFRFSTYAYWWIRQAVTRAIATQSKIIHLPMHITEKINKIKKAQRELTQQIGQFPTTKQVAKQLNLSPDQVREYLAFCVVPVSLDVHIGEDEDATLQEVIDLEYQLSPEDFAHNSLINSETEYLLSELSPQQQKILSMRYGLEDGNPRSLAKVSKELGLSRERIRQVEHSALHSLKKKIIFSTPRQSLNVG